MKFKTVADVVREQFDVPKGYDQLYVRSIEPGKTNAYGVEWPRTPGAALTADPANIYTANTAGCPVSEGDGFCLATTHRGMSSGVFTARTLLVVAVRDKDILGSELDGQKIRVRHALVVACVNGSKLVRRFGAGMDLTRANLCGVYLAGADLTRADLRNAYLRGANLRGANLAEANLRGANLTEAGLTMTYLAGANLTGANLAEASLIVANLAEANLIVANLRGANLRGANLIGTYLRGANLRGANLTGTCLTGANIEDAIR